MAKYIVELTVEEREYLTSITKKRKATSEAVKRSNILLAADRSGEKKWTDERISKTYQVSVRTVERLRARFVEEGLAPSLAGKPRPNLDKIKFDGEVAAKLIALRCGSPECGRGNWTLRLLAEKMVELSYVDSISHVTVGNILKKARLSLGG